MARYRKPTPHERLRSAEGELSAVYRDARARALSSEDIGRSVRAVKDRYATLPRYMRSYLDGYAWALRNVIWNECLETRFTLHGVTVPAPCSANDWAHLYDKDRRTLTVWKHAPERVYLDHGSISDPMKLE